MSLGLVVLLPGVIVSVVYLVVWIVRLLFLPQVMVLEGRFGWGAIWRTREVLRGRWWRAFVFTLAFSVLEALLSLAFLRWPLVHWAVQILLVPLGVIWVTLFFRAAAASLLAYGYDPRRV